MDESEVPRGRRRQDPTQVQQPQRRRRPSTTPKRATSEDDLKALTPVVAEKLIPLLGLDLIGLKADDIKDLVYSVLSSIAESRSSKLTEDVAIKKIMATKDGILKAIAASLLSREGQMTREQLEFIIAYAPDLAGRAAPYLYRVATKLNAPDVVDSLRGLWSQYGNPTPVECPRCGFRAVTPDLTCSVCGAELSEGELKRYMKFDEMLTRLTSRLHPRLIEEILAAGYVVLDGDINPPSMAPKQGFSLIIHLNKSERELLKKALEAYSGNTSTLSDSRPNLSQ